MPPRPSRRVGRGEGMPPAPDLGLPALAPRENTEASPTLVPLPSPGTSEDTNPTPSPATPNHRQPMTVDDTRPHSGPAARTSPVTGTNTLLRGSTLHRYADHRQFANVLDRAFGRSVEWKHPSLALGETSRSE